MLKAHTVGLVPSELPAFPDHDRHILRSTPGLYPDPLYPLGDDQELYGYPGLYTIDIQFQSESDEVLAQEQFKLEIIPVRLPPQKLIHTEWFHSDCIAT